MVNINIDVDKKTHEKLKELAKQRRTSLRNFLLYVIVDDYLPKIENGHNMARESNIKPISKEIVDKRDLLGMNTNLGF